MTFYTDPKDLDAVSRALPAFGFEVLSAKLGYKAKNPLSLGSDALADVEAWLEKLDQDDDVQEI